MPSELLTHSQDDLERSYDAPAHEPPFSYEQTPVTVPVRAEVMDDSTDVYLHASRTPGEGYLTYDEMMKRKAEAKKVPEKVYAPTAMEIMQQIGNNILVLRGEAMGLDSTKDKDPYGK